MKTVNLKDIPGLPDPEREAAHHQEMIGELPFWEFIERTRRIHELTVNRRPKAHYARGLDSKREDFA